MDHPGVPNAILVKESSEMAVLYDNKSVAEQNSVQLAWDVSTLAGMRVPTGVKE